MGGFMTSHLSAEFEGIAGPITEVYGQLQEESVIKFQSNNHVNSVPEELITLVFDYLFHSRFWFTVVEQAPDSGQWSFFCSSKSMLQN